MKERPTEMECSYIKAIVCALCTYYKPNVSNLLRFMTNHYNKDELKTLCFELDIDFEEIPGSTKTSKSRELIKYVKQRNSLHKLIAQVYIDHCYSKSLAHFFQTCDGEQMTLHNHPVPDSVSTQLRQLNLRLDELNRPKQSNLLNTILKFMSQHQILCVS